MHDGNSNNFSCFQHKEVLKASKEDPKQVVKIVRKQFRDMKVDNCRQRFVEYNKPNLFSFQSSDTIPPGSVVLFNGLLFASLYVLYMRTNFKMFSWGAYARSQYKKADSTHEYRSSASRQRFTYERVPGQPGQHGPSMTPRIRNGDMQHWEVDLARRHLQTLGISTSKLDSMRNVKALCAKEIKSAYLKTSLRTHPDMLNRNASKFERDINSKKFQAASLAYEELKLVVSRNQI
jgi:hypothetical protein